MDKISMYRNLDNKIFEEQKKYFPKTVDSNFRKEYPKTYILMNMFDTSATFLKNSIFDSCETDDYYGAKVVFRSLIEHFIRFQYLFTNWGKAKTDVFAEKYLDYGNAREVLDLIRVKISERQLADPNYKTDDWDNFLKEHPNFVDKSRKEVEQETLKYTFKNIVKFLNSEFKKGNCEMSPFLGHLITEYSSLSSFVHGGMKSYQEIMEANSEEKRREEYIRLSGLAFQMSTSIKLFSTLMYVQTDRESFSRHYLKINEILKKVNK